MTDATAPETTTSTPGIRPVSKAYQSYALGLLLSIYTLNFLDRQVVNILAEKIKLDLHLSDTQLGLMTGLAFAIFYTLLGLPIAVLADRSNRPWIISVAVAIWSLFTLLCGFAGNFTQLFLARIGVGIGEAGCSPPSHSLISDYVPGEKRSSAIAFYSLGTPLGSLLGAAMGGVVADAYGWRAAFMVAGAPGLIIAIIAAFTLIEPRSKAKAPQAQKQGLGEVVAEIVQAIATLAGKRTFWLIALGAAVMAFCGYAQVAFAPSFFFRNHAAELVALATPLHLKPTGFVGLVLGVIGGIAGLFGTFMGGQLADRLGARDRRWHVTLPAIAAAAGVPFFMAAIFAPSTMIAILFFMGPNLFNTMWYGPIYGTCQSLVPPRSRAIAAALILFIANIIGLGGGPWAMGALSDYLSKGQGLGPAEGLRWAMFASECAIVLATGLFLMARKTIREEIVS
jgi:MFS family permease